ncbi:hypothetical protein BDV96DRAFT_593651 [Lophiotrema nucula]|uniref:DUF6604 domain-containing protein n=1 Tax=Lophiotrema nucula TaxID=690887 RepID=A0A6A5ZWE3_9PLEO|nr:hypothetical protein BDV96DRAFT_593651 [Lophiotrema nucula]
MSGLNDSSFLSSHYRQYKKDTEYIAGWLAENAQRAGYRLSNEQNDDTKAPSTQRLKGKARKEARNAAKATADGPKQASSPKYLIKVGDFVPMAHTIYDHNPRPQVPAVLGRLFERAIATRQKANQWFAQASHNEEDDESGKQHEYFVNVLTEAYEILRPLTEEAAEGKKAIRRENIKLKNDEVPLTNQFSHLKVEDDKEEEEANREEEKALDEEEAHLPPVMDVELEQDEAEIESDFFFAIQGFLQNLADMREVIKGAWDQYLDGRLELVSVALFMNTAIDLVRHAEGELDISLKRPRKYADTKRFPVWTLPALLYIHAHPQMAGGGDRLHDQEMLLQFITPTAMVEGARGEGCIHFDFTLWPVYSGMRYYVWWVFDYKRPKMYAPKVNPSVFDPVGGAPDVMLRTLDVMYQFRTWTVDGHLGYARDEITRGVMHIFKEREIPLWTTFGVRLYLDMEDQLGTTGREKVYQELQNIMREKMDEYDDYREWKGPFKNSAHDGVDKTMRSIFKDLKHAALEEHHEEEVKANALRGGIFKFDLLLQLHKAGFRVEWNSADICLLGHLYMAGRLLYPDSAAWPDMEFLLYSQDPDYLFFGGIPKTLDEAHRKVELALGHSKRGGNIGKRRQGNYDLKTKGQRLFRDQSELTEIFLDRISGHAKTNESVDVAVKKLSHTLADKDKRVDLARQLNFNTEDLDNLLETTNFYFEQKEGPTRLLRHMRTWLEGNNIDLFFDWHRMNRTCGDIWRDIRDSLNDDKYWDYRFWRENAVVMTSNILERAAIDEAHAKGKLKLDDENFALQLRTAYQVIQKHIRAPSTTDLGNGKSWGGDACLARLLHYTSESADTFLGNTGRNIHTLYAHWLKEDIATSSVFRVVMKAISDRVTRMTHQFVGIQGLLSADEVKDINEGLEKVKKGMNAAMLRTIEARFASLDALMEMFDRQAEMIRMYGDPFADSDDDDDEVEEEEDVLSRD